MQIQRGVVWPFCVMLNLAALKRVFAAMTEPPCVTSLGSA